MDAFQPGDIGLIRSRDPFAWFEKIYAQKFKEGGLFATHGFIIREAPAQIAEATGLFIKNEDISEYAWLPMWIFRYPSITPEQLKEMEIYITATENGQGHYGFGGIWNFAKSFVTGKRHFQNAPGEFCTDFTGEIIKAAGLPYIQDLQPWEVDPTTQLNWLMGAGAALGWQLVYKQ